MALVTVVSRVSGYVRDKTLAFALGAGGFYDAFVVAFTIPNTFRALLAEGALHAAFIPTLNRLLGTDDGEYDARDLVRSLIASMLVILAIVVGLGVLFAPWLVRIFALGFPPDRLTLAVLMTRIMFPYLALISLAALCQGVLNSHDRFLIPAVTPVLLNLSIVGAGVLVSRGIGSPHRVLAMSVLIGGTLQLVVQAVVLPRLGYSLIPMWRRLFGRDVRRVLLLMLPGIPVLGINQINQLVSRTFASLTGTGGVTFTFNAYRITELVFGVLVVQLTTVLLPTLARDVGRDEDSARETLNDTLSLIVFVTLPSALVLALASRPIIGVLFGGGKYTAEHVAMTGVTLSAYAFGLIGLAVAKVMANAFYARQDTRTPVVGAAASLIVFVTGCALLSPSLGAPGIGLANTAAVSVYAATLLVLFRRRHGLHGVGRIVRPIIRFTVASVVLVGWLLLAGPWLDDVVATSLIGAAKLAGILGAGGALYVGSVRLAGGDEPRLLLHAVRRRGVGRK